MCPERTKTGCSGASQLTHTHSTAEKKHTFKSLTKLRIGTHEYTSSMVKTLTNG